MGTLPGPVLGLGEAPSVCGIGDVIYTNRQGAHWLGRRSPQPWIWGDRPNADYQAKPMSSWELAQGCGPRRSPGLEDGLLPWGTPFL